MGDRLHLQPAGFVKTPAQARLPAFLMHRPHVASRHVGDQQFDRVGADINDSAPYGSHAAENYKARVRKPN
jgi:hypothetical protein